METNAHNSFQCFNFFLVINQAKLLKELQTADHMFILCCPFLHSPPCVIFVGQTKLLEAGVPITLLQGELLLQPEWEQKYTIQLDK